MLAKKNKPEQLRQELISEISMLRIQFRDILTRYQSNMEAKMVWCINSLTATELDDLPDAARSKQELAEMIELLKLMKIKPSKGRFKDIKKINTAIGDILNKLSE